MFITAWLAHTKIYVPNFINLVSLACKCKESDKADYWSKGGGKGPFKPLLKYHKDP